ncbi:hypothetical protein O181_002293 [Austropuccinia psidii MF-1]|uniref:Uncharacterized protein n=1 Tax=Austropuccinia psidii MF-1 TaxID=1389203 RepID=A0A9Q3GCH7_9BASI|nr:hypothetical protein [Austropuccinia psidii MF-1]
MAKSSMDTIFQSMASGNHQRTPTQLPARSPLTLRGRFLFPQFTLYSRFHKWCIYGIIYYYAPFLLSNPMVTFSGPKLIPKSITIFEGGPFRYSVWQFPGGYQKIIQGTQPPVPAEFGLSFSHQDYSKGNSQRLSIFSIIVKESSTQHSLDNSIGPYR